MKRAIPDSAYLWLVCGACGQIVATLPDGKLKRHKSADGKRRCPSSTGR
jgi:hypothetical protein